MAVLIDEYKKIMEEYSFDLTNFNDESAKAFINDLFQRRKKERLFETNYFTNNGLFFKKANHMVSTFLMGKLLREIVEEQLKGIIKANVPLDYMEHNSNEYFEYPWLLCSLYHDIYSEYEKSSELEGISSLKSMIEVLKIEHTIYSPNTRKEWEFYYQPTYSRDTINRYYEYRLQRNNTDHGILSGHLAFDLLVKNYIEARSRNNSFSDDFYTETKDGVLAWDSRQFWVFALLSDAIMVHNIWHVSKEQNLPEEITIARPREKKLSITNTPLAYLLGLIDTIEPIKYFNSCNSDFVLNNISIDKSEDGVICISQSNRSPFNLKQWCNDKMSGLGCWMKGTIAHYCEANDTIIIVTDHSNG